MCLRAVADKQRATLNMRNLRYMTWASYLECALRKEFYRHYHRTVHRAMMQSLKVETKGNDEATLWLLPENKE